MKELAQTFFEISQMAYQYGSPWTVKQFTSDLAQPHSHYLTEGSEICAFLSFQQVCDEIEITNVASVDKGQGYGRKLMGQLLQRAESQAVASIFLEVRASNQEARLFYEKFGFQEIGIRKNYYHHPQEHAILMSLKVGNTK
ncbi:ribosomal protein S18-alanine N-acetyltransferase [Enterococcus hermanniensis]|uniref:[Ribosomal protein bS18]-alanine N-acetyltransferase n=1 Tax=Enterococcus hermanniensis TaxID=249189 RepID=A0A1L8TLC9_9ENTE|nr:ribosomal protein S18-alanine N-acetyltransferase [Enterococcus hermanniensis]OJG45145.1 ribosomal-protein-alanine acetyltransferase [Enterococcus hermanniensis]